MLFQAPNNLIDAEADSGSSNVSKVLDSGILEKLFAKYLAIQTGILTRNATRVALGIEGNLPPKSGGTVCQIRRHFPRYLR
jgi:hypothetical protein